MNRSRGALLVALVLVAFITPTFTLARFSESSAPLESDLSVGTFSPTIAPTPTVGLEGSSIRLRWAPVSFSGTSAVEYRVRRTSSEGTITDICTGASAPSMLDQEVSCLDGTAQAGLAYTYAIQPTLVRSGVTTWTLAFGQESQQVMIPGLQFAGGGTVVGVTTAGVVSVPYPAGTEAGDLLFLVVVNGRNRAPRRPTNWTDVVSRGIGGAQDLHLYASFRIADGAGSVAVDIDTGTEGASLQVFRYDVPMGSAPPVVRASQVQAGVTTVASSSLVPTPDIITTSAATAISIVAIRANNVLSVAPGSSWMVRSVANSTSGSTAAAWGIADVTVGVAATVPSPTWQQTGTPSRWIFGGSAFG